VKKTGGGGLGNFVTLNLTGVYPRVTGRRGRILSDCYTTKCQPCCGRGVSYTGDFIPLRVCVRARIQFHSIHFILYSPTSQIKNLPQRALQSVHIRHPGPRTSHRIRKNSQEIEKNLYVDAYVCLFFKVGCCIWKISVLVCIIYQKVANDLTHSDVNADVTLSLMNDMSVGRVSSGFQTQVNKLVSWNVSRATPTPPLTHL